MGRVEGERPPSEHSSPLLRDNLTQLEGTSPRAAARPAASPAAISARGGSFSYRLREWGCCRRRNRCRQLLPRLRSPALLPSSHPLLCLCSHLSAQREHLSAGRRCQRGGEPCAQAGKQGKCVVGPGPVQAALAVAPTKLCFALLPAPAADPAEADCGTMHCLRVYDHRGALHWLGRAQQLVGSGSRLPCSLAASRIQLPS